MSQPMNDPSFAIDSRLHLFGALAEAAEIEHNLMCLYLYAVFSLKRSESEGISTKELNAIEGWRKSILSVALEEMSHLTLVSNLMTALGGNPNFMRPNFPTSPGPYPASIIIELAPFSMSTLDHFIYLERPRSEEIKDGESFQPQSMYTRVSPKGRLMPSSGDYQTVGDLYLSILNGLKALCEDKGDQSIFCGSRSQQIGPLDSPLPGLALVTSEEEAVKAIQTIIHQGEGGEDVPDSHFNRFKKIKAEYEALLKENPNFQPARNVARNPVMRKPLTPENRVWVTEPLAAEYMDIANALYGLMLRTLVQLYSVENRPREAKRTLLSMSYSLMHGMASVAETLTLIPASESDPTLFSGMSFAMVRTLNPLQVDTEKILLGERLGQITQAIMKLQDKLNHRGESDPRARSCVEQLESVVESLTQTAHQIARMPDASTPLPASHDLGNIAVNRVVNDSAKTTLNLAHASSTEEIPGIEVSETDQIKLLFEAKRCIHSRHCVTELPQVFKANTPGKWIFAENAEVNILAAVARECPSGAIRYERKDGATNELAPDVNLMRIRENGPYAFLGDLEIDGEKCGSRATLCRCGKSQNKPFCDGSHNAAKFAATGECPTIDDTALSSRNGELKINRTKDGPLSVEGNVEICAGTGRVVLRTNSVKLCRCGQSKTKPICDSSHIAAGFRDQPDLKEKT